MQDTNKKWDAMVNICLNAAKKVLEEKSKSKNNRYKNEGTVQRRREKWEVK